MPKVIVVERPDPVLSLEEAKRHLQISGTALDDDIEALVAAVTAQIDGPNGWLGLSLGPQTLEWQGNSFPACGAVELICGPVASVVSITYRDPTGLAASVALADVELLGGSLYPRRGFSWPATDGREASARIRYEAGHQTDALPAQILPALKLMLGDLWRASSASGGLKKEVVEGVGSFEWAAPGEFDAASNRAASALLSPLRALV